MNKIKLRKIASLLLILIGSVLLIIELGAAKKNYYMQSVGIVSLMIGIFSVNTSLSSRSLDTNTVEREDYEEEE